MGRSHVERSRVQSSIGLAVGADLLKIEARNVDKPLIYRVMRCHRLLEKAAIRGDQAHPSVGRLALTSISSTAQQEPSPNG